MEDNSLQPATGSPDNPFCSPGGEGSSLQTEQNKIEGGGGLPGEGGSGRDDQTWFHRVWRPRKILGALFCFKFGLSDSSTPSGSHCDRGGQR